MSRKIVFAIALIIIIALAVVVAVALMILSQPTSTMPKVEPPAFDLSLSPSNGTVLQGGTLQTTATVYNFTGLEIVSLSADSSSTGITCSFNQTSGNDTFASLLTLSVPAFTDTGNYSVIVTATNGPVIRNSAYNISVLSSNVTLSGQVLASDGIPIPFVEMDFRDLQTNKIYSVIGGDSYSITLQNQHTYDVKVTYMQLNLGQIPTQDLGNYNVNAPAGSTSLTHDFIFPS